MHVRLQELKKFLEPGWPKYITNLVDSCKIYYKFKDEISTDSRLILRNERIAIPQLLRREMIKKIHVNPYWYGGDSQTGSQQCLLARNFCTDYPGYPGLRNLCTIDQITTTKTIDADSQNPGSSILVCINGCIFHEIQMKKSKSLVTLDHFSGFLNWINYPMCQLIR